MLSSFFCSLVLAVEALSGMGGYGVQGRCIQDPGAQAGAYVYAGTAVPYEAPGAVVVIPDSLEVVFVNHVGRHGARFLSSDKSVERLRRYLEGCGGLTPVGVRVRDLCRASDSVMSGRWGALDALGREEQSGIGHRMAARYGGLLARNDSVEGISSYVPRCVMSMDELVHGVVWDVRSLEVVTGSGKRFSPLLRFFDESEAYDEYKKTSGWKDVYEGFCDSVCPASVVLRLSEGGSRLIRRLCEESLRDGVDDSGASMELALEARLKGEWPVEWTAMSGLTKKEALDLAGDLYSVVAGCEAVAPEIAYDVCDWRCFFTSREFERLWECGNLKHYLTYSANGLSDVPATMASPLLRELVESLEDAARKDYSGPAVRVRLGHAETMMPLLALMDLPGCRYVTSEWGSVADHWMDWNVATMAANLQLVLCRSLDGERDYLITLRNEMPVGAPEPLDAALERMRSQAGMTR